MFIFDWAKRYWALCHPHEHRFKRVEGDFIFESSVVTGVPIQVGYKRKMRCKCGETREVVERTGAGGQQDGHMALLKAGYPIIWADHKITWDPESGQVVYEKLPAEFRPGTVFAAQEVKDE